MSKIHQGSVSAELIAEAFVIDVSEIAHLVDTAECLSFHTQSIIRKGDDGTVFRKAWLVVGSRSHIVKDVATEIEREWRKKVAQRHLNQRVVTSKGRSLSYLAMFIMIFSLYIGSTVLYWYLHAFT